VDTLGVDGKSIAIATRLCWLSVVSAANWVNEGYITF
jgi:hypothetical protein